MILGDLFERNALCFPDHPAFLFEGRVVTHRELGSDIRRLVNALVGLGCARQDRLAILSRNCPEYMAVYGAAGLGGFVALGINFRLSLPEQLSILTNAEPKVLFYEREYAARVAELRPRLPADTRYICFDGPQEGALAYADVLQAAPDTAPALRAEPQDTVFLVYTSGTTGEPKGVMHGNVRQAEQAMAVALPRCAAQTDRMLIVMPLFHIGGLAELLSYLVTGATIVLHRTFEPAAVLRSMQDDQVTAAHLGPTMIQMLLEIQESRPHKLDHLHTVIYASAPMSVALLRRVQAVFGPVFMQAYGMSELCMGTSLLKHQHLTEGRPEQVARLASAGQAFLGTEVRIVNDNGEPCPPGVVGDLLLRSKLVMLGYWKRPDATREAFTEDGFLKTGDMGFLDEEGYLFIVDRKKDMVISGGENIYSREVEEVLLHHPAVLEAAVIGTPDPKWGEAVTAVLVLRPGHKVTEDDIVQHCKQSLASYKKPKHVVVLDAMPRVSSTNKIDKRALRAPYWQGRDRQVS